MQLLTGDGCQEGKGRTGPCGWCVEPSWSVREGGRGWSGPGTEKGQRAEVLITDPVWKSSTAGPCGWQSQKEGEGGRTVRNLESGDPSVKVSLADQWWRERSFRHRARPGPGAVRKETAPNPAGPLLPGFLQDTVPESGRERNPQNDCLRASTVP